MAIGIRRRIAIVHLLVTVLSGLILSSLPALAKPLIVRGTVFYRERIALPPSAIVEVSLQDVSRADAPASTIALTRLRSRGHMPIPYRLRFDSKKIDPRHTYSLRARILVDGRLWFTSATRHPIPETGNGEVDILVQRVSGPAGNALPASPSGRWRAEYIRQECVDATVAIILDLAEDGRLSGTGGCNRMAGRASVSGQMIRFRTIARTNMACMPAIMAQENQFFTALDNVRMWRLDRGGRKLALLDDRGEPLIRLARLQQ